MPLLSQFLVGLRKSYSLSNAAEDTPLLTMAQRKSQRYFIERSNQDAKSEFGWDEFQAIKYAAWEHHLAVIRRHAPETPDIQFIERFAFYDRAKTASAVILTGEVRKYGNVILKKGVC